MLLLSLLLSGCSEDWLEEDGYNSSVNYEEAYEQDGNDSLQDESGSKGEVTVSTDNEAACQTDENYIAEDDTCAITVSCSDGDSCIAWSEDVATSLTNQYGDFLEVTDVSFSGYDESEEVEEEEDLIATYAVRDGHLILKGEHEDADTHALYWQDYLWLIPKKERSLITSFSVFTHNDTLAYVVQDEDDYENWNLAVNIDAEMTPNSLVGTLIHEYGHILFLNKEELDPHIDEYDCDTGYIDGMGCPYESSYVYTFRDQFWHEDEYDYDSELFVSDYASSDVVEDLAESWMYFVFSAQPAGDTLADEKILFFYEYEELIMLRAEILSRVVGYMNYVTAQEG